MARDRRVLSPDEVQQALAALPGWALEQGRLFRAFVFPDFPAAFAFMTRVALHAERLNHHPDWQNSHTRVEIRLITHDLGALSPLDLELARRISAAAAETAVSG